MSKILEHESSHGGRVARLWLNRPEVHNALNAALLESLTSTMSTLGKDTRVRVVVLGGRGASFCAGADLGDMKASADATFDANLADAERFGGALAAVADCPKPVIVRAHGNVFGGGVGFTAASDLALGADNAVFAISEVRLGIIPGLISPYLVRRMGDRNARPLMLSGERFSGAHAVNVGLLHRALPADQLDAAVDAAVAELLKGAPQAQARIKEVLRVNADEAWSDVRTRMPRTLAEVRSGDEAKEGFRAFFEKRKPAWVAELDG
jgi:methylglutaconyl-CoA hydratase